MTLRLSGIIDDSVTDGPGLRLVVFAQGCRFNCPGCHNPEAHAMDGGFDCSVDEIVERAAGNPLLSGVTFSGGEPFLQARAFCELAGKLKEELPLLVLIVYTGYVFEELADVPFGAELIGLVDFIVDGRFEADKKSLGLKFKGSSNQRFIDVKKTLESGEVREIG